jgi:hypothetical protein
MSSPQPGPDRDAMPESFGEPVYTNTAEQAVPDGSRMADLVNMARLAFSRGDNKDRMRTNIRVILKGHGTVTVWGVIDGAGLTLMLPEDY